MKKEKEHIMLPAQIGDSVYIMYWFLLYERKEINHDNFKWLIGSDNAHEILKNHESLTCIDDSGNRRIMGFEFEIDTTNPLRFDLLEFKNDYWCSISDDIKFVNPKILFDFIAEVAPNDEMLKNLQP